jgi:dihydroorotate dehydrogenase subfamily 1
MSIQQAVELDAEICGIRFPNPVLTAAGPPVRDGSAILACAAGGAGGLVTKTISRTAATPPTPNMAEVSHGFLNAELWSELSPERWIEREYAMAREAGLPVIVSLGYTADDIADLAPRVRPFADALELSTHYIGEDAAPMVAAIRAAKAAVDVPVFVKLSPLGREMRRAAEQAEAAGADAIVAINSFGPCLAIDIESGLPRMGGEDGYGWLSGPALKPLAVRCIHDVASAVKIPVIGCGGVSRGADVIEMLMAGASAVQVCTAAILRGPAVFGKIATETATWLDRHGYQRPSDVVGLALGRDATRTAGVPLLDLELCNGCGLCELSCAEGAIQVVDGKAVIDEAPCSRCGLCLSRCRPGALLWAPVPPERRGLSGPRPRPRAPRT